MSELPPLPSHREPGIEPQRATEEYGLPTEYVEGEPTEPEEKESHLGVVNKLFVGGIATLLLAGTVLLLTQDGESVATETQPAVSISSSINPFEPLTTLPPIPTTAAPAEDPEPEATTTTIPDTPPDPIDKEVTFLETFETLDESIWRIENVSSFGDGNNEEQCYLRENVSVRNGKLVLRAREQTVQCENDTREVTSGMVRSQGVTFSPGQGIDFRVRLTPSNDAQQGGLWPALWASSFGGGAWPLGGELDFFEVMTAVNPKRVIFSAHYKNEQNRNDKTSREIFLDNNFSGRWHTFRFDYGADGVLRWYLNGELAQEITELPTQQGYPTPFDSVIRQLRVNLALGGNPGPLDRAALAGNGATYEVDYIRIFNL